MKANPLLKLKAYGQSIWLDYIRRHMIDSGELQRLIDEDGLRGVTSNPSIFEKAIAGSHDYEGAIRAMALEGKTVKEMYWALTIEDIRRTADLFRPLYDESEGRHGFVSLEVNPHLARDTEGTIAEARRLWSTLDRPNVFIKVPATLEGLPAIEQLISEGININVTLLFGLPRYREVAGAYISGLEKRLAEGQEIERVASVASFFLSRIDVLVDPKLEKLTASNLRGKVAIASAKVAYQMYKRIFGSQRFRKLADRGARAQRVLWASTSTKNPEYSDIKYVEPLIGPETINTLPQETMDAYRDHGNPVLRLEEGITEAYDVLQHLARLGIDIDEVTQQLEDEGIEKFNKPYDSLMDSLKEKRSAALEEHLDRQTLSIPRYKSAFQRNLTRLQRDQFCTRLWSRDPALWKKDPQNQKSIRNGLGWLHAAEKMEENTGEILAFRSEVKEAGFRHVVHMGMGGSSLAPLAFERTFTPSEEGLPLTVLDTTDPGTILRIDRKFPVEDNLFIVASKSGTTAEPIAFMEYFFARVKALKGDRAGGNFVAITDPSTPLAQQARERSFRRVFRNFVDIGGRYSALSYFGLVPAALMGVDIDELLIRALRMRHGCDSCVPIGENPGVVLGIALGKLAKNGLNKITFFMPESLSTFAMWLEQLLAESTGKEGKGLLPIAGEPLGHPSVYAKDRVFIYFRLRDDVDERLEKGITLLKESGHPVVTIQMEDRLDIGQEFFRWEIATATAGVLLNINPFDQPNVQESKENTNRLLEEIERTGKLSEPRPTFTEGSLSFYDTEKVKTSKDCLKAFFRRARKGDYVSLQAYLPETPEINPALQAIRVQLRDHLHLATTLGYGPRFLHSTGQFHKGGPNNGLFLQLTADDLEDVSIPDQPYTFGVLRRAQALGDLQALRKHRRRAIRIHLGADIAQGVESLSKAIEAALR
jgi:transaldolase/glucose-6-phosphate isomerase